MAERSDRSDTVAPVTPIAGDQVRTAELCRRIGYRFDDDALLELALRHRSWCSEHGGVESNERLEFLGDSVLGLVVTEHLFAGSPTSSEGVLARRRSELVSANALAGVARGIGLGEALRLGKGEESTGGRTKTSILAAAMEGVFGAVYLDGGLEAARAVVLTRQRRGEIPRPKMYAEQAAARETTRLLIQRHDEPAARADGHDADRGEGPPDA